MFSFWSAGLCAVKPVQAAEWNRQGMYWGWCWSHQPVSHMWVGVERLCQPKGPPWPRLLASCVWFGIFFLLFWVFFFLISLSKFCSRSQWSYFLWNLNLFFLPQKVVKLAPFQGVCVPNVTLRAFDTLIQHKEKKKPKRWSGQMFGPHQG